ncbi:MAG: hypothetical protein DLM69_01215, partial [Candidatus Chloroheliales bacterium]
MLKRSTNLKHRHPCTLLIAICAAFTYAALVGESIAAQSAPSGDRSYALRLIVTISPSAGARQVYAIFGGAATYALAAEGGGRYSLEAAAEATQNGAEVYLANGGAQERRDRITWTAYPGYKLTVEVDYRQNQVGGLELGKVSQAVGKWAQVTSVDAAGSDQASSDLLSGGTPPATTGNTGPPQLASSDTAPAWAGGGGNTAPTTQVRGTVTSTGGVAAPHPPTIVATATATTTAPAAPRPPTPQTQGMAGLINAQNV